LVKYLVTGGAGFIGSNIVEELVDRNESVRVLDNLSTGRRENIDLFMDTQVSNLCYVEFIEGDLRECTRQWRKLCMHYNTVRKAVNGVDFVLHQGALPSVQRSIDDPSTTNELNVNGTLNVLFLLEPVPSAPLRTCFLGRIAARDAGVKRVAGDRPPGGSIYGNSEVLPACA